MSLQQYVEDLCLSALWSGGYEVTRDTRSRIQQSLSGRSFKDSSDRILAEGAKGVLQEIGYSVLGDDDTSRLLPPCPTPTPAYALVQDDTDPRPGHAVKLRNAWCGAEAGRVGALSGTIAHRQKGYTIGFPSSLFQDDEVVSISNGGPVSILYLDISKLTRTPQRVDVRRWRWRTGMAQGHSAVSYVINVPLWIWSGSEADFLDSRMAEIA
ncbi:hypothetical protein [Microvirga tunisiensis]|uniref:Uncharacterized protein n=1 Tax=Microvirga tunisiensis TaxID=2108360 RepID=A0A5N7MPM5_9HYPH|nr:hypothetical protein [Microvirga tunisiensis]MPR09229.1 hypothetical protein [Microvirga tunisiensis]MPR28798.1 hypothetical protein [Microvirga tunisiensis]